MGDEMQRSKGISRSINGYAVRDDFHDGEPRIRDLELAIRLGYARPRKLRDLIRSLLADGKLNDVTQRPVVGRREDGMPMKPSVEYWLTQKQALKIIAKSETATADKILDEVIDVFVAVMRGDVIEPARATHLLLSDSPSEWRELWGKDLHDALCDIYGQPKGGRPRRFVGGLQAKLYKLIAGEDCYVEMKRRTPNPRHRDNLHQHFSGKARTGFEEQLAVVFGVLRTSHNPADFWERMEHLYAGRPMQLRMGGAA